MTIAPEGAISQFSIPQFSIPRQRPYSHSIVPGGFDVTS
jgi:hypothetical protein